MTNENLTILPISDLHIGLRSSFMTPTSLLTDSEIKKSGISHEQRVAARLALEKAMEEPDIVVINGDFKHNSSKEKNEPGKDADRAMTGHCMDLLERWLIKHPKKTFYFVLGNHDGNTQYDFRDRLLKLEKKHQNLHVTDYGVKIGDILFTHGDLQTRHITPSDRRDCRNGRDHERLLNGVDKSESGVNMLLSFHHMMEREALAKGFVILRHGEDPSLLTLDELKAIPNVMFGHSHVHIDAIDDHVRHDDTMIMNSGSTIKYKKKIMPDHKLIDQPADLKQQMLHLKNGRLEGVSRVFPKIDSWRALPYVNRGNSPQMPIHR